MNFLLLEVIPSLKPGVVVHLHDIYTPYEYPEDVVLVRRQFFNWGEIESADYPTYIANLKDIHCPEQTIRDLIIADVNALYARRRAADPALVTPEQQWWLSEPDTNVLQAANEKLSQIQAGRRQEPRSGGIGEDPAANPQ